MLPARPQVHVRSIEIDLLLLLLRDVLAQRALAASSPPSSSSPSSSNQPPPLPPLQLVLMSATADAQLFSDYMTQRLRHLPGSSSSASASAAPSNQQLQQAPVAGVGMLTIPGFTYPVRELYLEDILECTGHQIGKSSK